MGVMTNDHKIRDKFILSPKDYIPNANSIVFKISLQDRRPKMSRERRKNIINTFKMS